MKSSLELETQIQPVYIDGWTSQGLRIAVVIGNWSATAMRVRCDCAAIISQRSRIAVAAHAHRSCNWKLSFNEINSSAYVYTDTTVRNFVVCVLEAVGSSFLRKLSSDSTLSVVA
jgi:hypothetical protein